MNARLALAAALLLIAAVACTRPAPVKASHFEIAVHASNDDGAALPGVTFTAGNVTLGTTNETGAFSVRLRGGEGQTLPLAIACPEGYEQTGEPPSLRLTGMPRADRSIMQPLAINAICIRKLRDVVLVVRSENAVSLPVYVDGKSTTATSSDGTAHLLLQLARDVGTVGVTLDTTAQPKLRPQNPGRTFELHGKDTVLIMDQSFGMPPKPQSRAPSALPRHIRCRVQ